MNQFSSSVSLFSLLLVVDSSLCAELTHILGNAQPLVSVANSSVNFNPNIPRLLRLNSLITWVSTVKSAQVGYIALVKRR